MPNKNDPAKLVLETIANITGTAQSHLTPDTLFFGDLGVTDQELSQILTTLEEELEIELSVEEIKEKLLGKENEDISVQQFLEVIVEEYELA